jgi:hypothetical protein
MSIAFTAPSVLAVGCCAFVVPFIKANLSSVSEHRPGRDIDFPDVAEISRRSGEFTCSAFDMHGVGHNSENGLRDWNGCRDGWIEKDCISRIGHPVMLNNASSTCSRARIPRKRAASSSQFSAQQFQGKAQIDFPIIRNATINH